jgi:hypothetical protein
LIAKGKGDRRNNVSHMIVKAVKSEMLRLPSTPKKISSGKNNL